MIPTFDAYGGTVPTANANTMSWTHVCTGADLYLLAFVYINASAGGTVTCTYNGVSMTNLGSYSPSGTFGITVFGLPNPATGSHTVAASWTSSRACAGASVSYTGVNSITPTASSGAGGSGQTSPVSENIASHSNHILVEACFGVNSTTTIPTITAGGSQTSRGTSGAANGTIALRVRISDLQGDGLKSMSYTFSNAATVAMIQGVPLRGQDLGFWVV